MKNELAVVLTGGAVRNAYIKVPPEHSLFDKEYLANDESDSDVKLFTLIADDGTEFKTCVLKNKKRLKQRFYAYFKSRNIKEGTSVIIRKIDKGKYSMDFKYDKNTLAELFEEYLNNPRTEWIENYKSRCEQVNAIRLSNTKLIDQEVLRDIWFEKANGVASVGQGMMYKREFDSILPRLSEITLSIINNPSPENLDAVIEWAESEKNKGNLERIIKAVIYRVFAAANPNEYSMIVNDKDINKIIKTLNNQYDLSINKDGNWANKSAALMKAIREQGLNDKELYTLNTFSWYLIKRLVASTDDEVEAVRVNESNSKVNNISLNKILYGPPGTGKTFHTINRALEILEPDFYRENKENRTALKKRFDTLKEQNLIGFVTFHQSFSYEDFVEGLRAEASDDGAGVHYYVQDGIFKILCDEAKKDANSGSIDEAITNLIEKTEEEPLRLQTSSGKYFLVTYRGGRTFRIKPESSDKAVDYPASIENIKRIYRGGNIKDVYNPSYVLGILNHLQSEYDLNDVDIDNDSTKPVVLIIDEINRGNTANIFGELITLIEPSKRSGQDEMLNVTLPYSQEKFSVPSNLYIIGTMNTADRSLSHIDTALRRRFVFEEMMPKPSLLSNIVVEGINLEKMLSIINDRIEVLYDREHTLGHSFFLTLDNKSEIQDLAEIFDKQIIPLLEEYFFEDWDKIRLVLGDNRKSKKYSFITKKYDESKLVELLGNEYQHHSQSSVYERNASALLEPLSYIKIYQINTMSDNE